MKAQGPKGTRYCETLGAKGVRGLEKAGQHNLGHRPARKGFLSGKIANSIRKCMLVKMARAGTRTIGRYKRDQWPRFSFSEEA